jgi:hypothetical protein
MAALAAHAATAAFPHDPIADFESSDLRPDLTDLTHPLVTWNHRIARQT